MKKVEIPSIPSIKPINIPKIDVKPVSIPKINIQRSVNNQTSPFSKMDSGYKKGYDDGYYALSDSSNGKDTIHNDYWLGYSCGYRDGKFDRENGNSKNC